MAKFERKMRDFGEEYIIDINRHLRQKDKVATGRLINSIGFQLGQIGDRTTILIEAEKYFTIVDEGRRPGTYPPIQAIRDWCSIRGIDESAAFPIAKKIYRFGIKPTRILQDVNRNVIDKWYFKRLEEGITGTIEDNLVAAFTFNKPQIKWWEFWKY